MHIDHIVSITHCTHSITEELLQHYSLLPKNVSQNQFARQRTNGIYTCSSETTTKIASSHINDGLKFQWDLKYQKAISNLGPVGLLKKSSLSLRNQSRVSSNTIWRSQQFQNSDNTSTLVENQWFSLHECIKGCVTILFGYIS